MAQRSYRFVVETPTQSADWVRRFVEEATQQGVDAGDIISWQQIFHEEESEGEANILKKFERAKRKAELVLLPLLIPEHRDDRKIGRDAALHMLELCDNSNAYVVHELGDIPEEGSAATYRPHIEAYDALRMYCEAVGAHRVLNRKEALQKLVEMSRAKEFAA